MQWSARFHLTRFFGMKSTKRLIQIQILATLSSIFMTISIHYGFGRHVSELTPLHAQDAVKYSLVSRTFFILNFAVTKISIALYLLLRVVGAARRTWHKVLLYFVIISGPLIQIPNVVLIYVQCRPVQKLWNHQIHGSCWDPKVSTIFSQFSGGMATLPSLRTNGFPFHNWTFLC